MAKLGDDLEYGAICHYDGTVLMVGWHGDKVWLCGSSRTDLVRETLDGSNELIEVCSFPVAAGGEKPRTALVVMDDGAIDVCVGESDAMRIHRCRDYRQGFVAV